MAYIKGAARIINGSLWNPLAPDGGSAFPVSIPAADGLSRQFVWLALYTTNENATIPGHPRVYYTDPNTLIQTEVEMDFTDHYDTSVIWNGTVFVVFKVVELGTRNQEWTEIGFEYDADFTFIDGDYFWVDSREDDDSYIPTATRQEIFNSAEDIGVDTEWTVTDFENWEGLTDSGVPLRSDSGSIGYFAFGEYGDNGVSSAYADVGYDDSPPAYFGEGLGPGFAEFPPSTAGRSSNHDALVHLHPLATSYSIAGVVFEFAAVPAPAPGVVALVPRSRQVKIQELPYTVRGSQLTRSQSGRP